MRCCFYVNNYYNNFVEEVKSVAEERKRSSVVQAERIANFIPRFESDTSRETAPIRNGPIFLPERVNQLVETE